MAQTSTSSSPVPIPLKLFAGGLAGVSETLVTYPAEFLKTSRQLPSQAQTYTGLKYGIIERKPASTWYIVKQTYTTSGVRGFYSGVTALAISNFAKAGIRFLAFEAIRDRLDNFAMSRSGLDDRLHSYSRPAWINAVSGLGAGMVESALVVTPGEAIKTRMVATGAKKNLPVRTQTTFARFVTQIVKTEGIFALWKGIGPVLCKQGTNSAVRFSSFGIMQETLYTRYPAMQGNMLSTLMLGGMSGIVTVYASMPFDNIKTRMQSGTRSYQSMLQCARQTFLEDGILAFWKGTAPRLVRLTLSSGITFAVYDQVVGTMKTLTTHNGNSRTCSADHVPA